ncbi:phosphoglycolate phosphatase-like HAD superfamily hydrolase [Cellulomonas sp. URHB0016]
MTPLMPAPLNLAAANAAREALALRGAMPENVAATSDHLAIIRWAGTHAPHALAGVEAACSAADVEAARTSLPTPGAHELIAALDDAGLPVVIVTNNAASAARTYLARFGLLRHIRDIVGRPENRPDLMTPNSHMVQKALRIAGALPGETVLIGDAVSDVQVAHAAGLRAIGFAKNPRRGQELQAAHADALTQTISALVPG